ncbi:hypothetical protein VTJ04DRAFT_3415 [Mycothermus thermophilus]|uniref:uncharacterized protein n=1 Tax=Humicola insolens TaxID=85995 RepID=UPI0037427F1F
MDITLFPIDSLPSCVTSCGPLYDVNGGCVPPEKPVSEDPRVYGKCFCDDSRLEPFKTGTAGVCDQACQDPNDLAQIQGWYVAYCNEINAPESTPTPTKTAAPQSGGGGGTWIETHYQWVIFLVVMVVAIVGIWVGACVWRRRYLRKKDRAYALGSNLARATESGRIVPLDSTASIHVPRSGFFAPAPISSAAVYGEKDSRSKMKWPLGSR